jgi:hypothetical protein
MSPSKYVSGTATYVGPVEPVYKSITVRANAARAFKVFTEGLDSWWPKTHHVGSSPMIKGVVEGHVGGRIYCVQEDGDDCQWGEVLVWNPPTHFAMAWMVQPSWQIESDAAKCSEVHVAFTPNPDGSTLVELEHRHFERHGEGGAHMRGEVDGGWGGLMELYRNAAEAEA